MQKRGMWCMIRANAGTVANTKAAVSTTNSKAVFIVSSLSIRSLAREAIERYPIVPKAVKTIRVKLSPQEIEALSR